jgi:hypothetical protein
MVVSKKRVEGSEDYPQAKKSGRRKFVLPYKKEQRASTVGLRAQSHLVPPRTAIAVVLSL